MSLNHQAQKLANNGFRVFPLKPNDKTPAIDEWQNRASTDVNQICDWWSKGNRECNIGIATGNGLIVIDLDVKKGDNGIVAWDDLTRDQNVPKTLSVATPSGGVHHYFHTSRTHRNTAGKLAKGIDTRGDGGYVVAPPSQTDIGKYWFTNENEIAQLPEFLEDMLDGCEGAKVFAKKSKEQKVVPTPQITVKLDINADGLSPYVNKALEEECNKVASALPGTRNDQLVKSAFSLGSLISTPGSGLTEAFAEEQLMNAANVCGLTSDPGDGDRKTMNTIRSGLGAGMSNPRPNLGTPMEAAGSGRGSRTLVTDDYIKLIADWGYSLRTNLMNNDLEINGIPMTDVEENNIIARIRDYSITKRFKINTQHAKEAISIMGQNNSYHPILEYLAKCQHKPGAIAELIKHFSDEAGLFPRWLEHWLCGSIAKVIDGYQNPVLVLDGMQDQGKSFFAKWLCPLDRLFYAGPIQPDSKDCRFKTIDTWVWEIEELGATTRKQDVDALKAFITMTELKDRKAYGRRDIQKKVTSSYIGTINNSSGFLVDKTGNRRFHVLTLDKLDWNYTNIPIADIWGEAYHLYKEGGWKLTAEDKEKRNTNNELYEVEDPVNLFITPMIEFTGQQGDFLTIKDILERVSKKVSINQRAQTMEIASTLKRMGGVKTSRRVDGIVQRGYACVRWSSLSDKENQF